MFQREILFFSEDDRACDSARDLSEGRTEGRGHKKKRRGWEDREMLGDREKSVVAPVVVGGGWWFVELWRWWPDNSGAFSLSLCLSSFSSRVYRRLCQIRVYKSIRANPAVCPSLSFSLFLSLFLSLAILIYYSLRRARPLYERPTRVRTQNTRVQVCVNTYTLCVYTKQAASSNSKASIQGSVSILALSYGL